jgi:hypothetical protein
MRIAPARYLVSQYVFSVYAFVLKKYGSSGVGV